MWNRDRRADDGQNANKHLPTCVLSTLQLTDNFIAFKQEKDAFQQRGFISLNADKHIHMHTKKKLEKMRLR